MKLTSKYQLPVAITLLLFCVNLVFAQSLSNQERAALIEIYQSLNGEQWENGASWKTSPLGDDGFSQAGSENSWYGLEFDNQGNLTGLYLDDANLCGKIPHSIADLKLLTTLVVNTDKLPVVLNKAIFKIENLKELQLSGDHLLNISLDESISQLNQLEILEISSRNFDGFLPDQIGNLTNLNTLYLSCEYLQEIPQSVINLTKLKTLGIEGIKNRIPFPTTICQIKNLENLYLDQNSFVCQLPNSIGNLNNLKTLWINNCPNISGPIPVEISELENLVFLNLSNNGLDPIVPTEITTMKALKKFYFEGNLTTNLK